jgi:phosphoribosylamine--glycine ligase
MAALCARSVHRPEILGVSEIDSPGLIACSDRFAKVPSLRDVEEVVGLLAADGGVDLAVIGPEDPLCAGLVDRLRQECGTACFGPDRAHARIEASKSWARGLVDRHGIEGNPRHRVFRQDGSNEIGAWIRELGHFVVKPDGLTGGKGVRVSGEHLGSVEEALAYAEQLLSEDGIVVIEERLEGEEFSLQTITDGTGIVHCPIVQDHKRAFDGDTGPNTGGMGSYSMPDHSMPWLTDEDVNDARRLNELVVKALGEELDGPYRGVLYGGFMATEEGVRLVEYNARFGDPEGMNVLPLLETDLVELCWSVATGTLEADRTTFEHKATVCKYVVPAWYPGAAPSGATTGLRSDLRPATAPMTIDADEVQSLLEEGSVQLYWASVNLGSAGVTMTGSRALAVVGIGETLETAEARAENAASLVRGPVRHRHDIGTAELLRRRCEHMERLRG